MNSVELMSLYVAYLRALYQIHQNNHWKCKGTDFYGNHLLFERLYGDVLGMSDNAAEKAIGVFGSLDTCSEKIAEIVGKFTSEDNFLLSSLKAEKAFLALSKTVYDELEKSKELTLGMDDLIMANANISENHCYLLQQALNKGQDK